MQIKNKQRQVHERNLRVRKGRIPYLQVHEGPFGFVKGESLTCRFMKGATLICEQKWK